jgi:hypothetical protein
MVFCGLWFELTRRRIAQAKQSSMLFFDFVHLFQYKNHAKQKFIFCLRNNA